ncbi:LmeA family phospholipid-binding protein [Streptomyces sp. SID5785]|uniref:LmeA family phospholipid-binding protein n=1 Tax=Streptomyces sp. SID5785 TaxID=2690309 RepID=UPI001361CB1A|nr:DUF2993 domain-containing protein [Streptomyces sp. SID5785]MZD08793.1 LmeA family phospholipid-binding protein [Streptomyces sp. SID5785]
MRTLRRLAIVAVVLAALLVGADRLAVHILEGKAADRLAASIGLSATPDVSIKGFPFLTQIATGDLDEIDASIDSYESTVPGGSTARIEGLELQLKNVEFSNSYTSATARTATGTALIPYDQLLRAAASDPDSGAKVTRLSDGGNGRIKVEVEADGQRSSVLSTVKVADDTIRVRAEKLPDTGGIPEDRVREITDFQQTITRLPGGVSLQNATPTPEGLRLTVGGTNVPITG